jgi:hypothetical protein
MSLQDRQFRVVAGTPRPPCADHTPSELPADDPAVPFSLALLESARQCLVLADYPGTPDTLRALAQASRPFQRLQLDFEACENFMTTAAEDVAQPREVLSV